MRTVPAVSTPSEATYVRTAALAARWDVSAATALNRTKAGGFPAPLNAGDRAKRWLLERVIEWEQHASSPRRVVTAAQLQPVGVAPDQLLSGWTRASR